MKRMLTIIASLTVAFIALTASADTNLWITTEGAGIEVSTGHHHPTPPPPPHHRHSYHNGHCKICKKHYKEMRKAEKRHHKEMRKINKNHRKHHHR